MLRRVASRGRTIGAPDGIPLLQTKKAHESEDSWALEMASFKRARRDQKIRIASIPNTTWLNSLSL